MVKHQYLRRFFLLVYKWPTTLLEFCLAPLACLVSSMQNWTSWCLDRINSTVLKLLCCTCNRMQKSIKRCDTNYELKACKGIDISRCFFPWIRVPSFGKDFIKHVYTSVCSINNFQCFYVEWKIQVEMLVWHVSFRTASFTHTNQHFLSSYRFATSNSSVLQQLLFFVDELKWIVILL